MNSGISFKFRKMGSETPSVERDFAVSFLNKGNDFFTGNIKEITLLVRVFSLLSRKYYFRAFQQFVYSHIALYKLKTNL